MQVPMIDLVRQHEGIQDEMNEAILSVVRSGKFILGNRVQVLEEEVANYCGVKHAIGVASGTDALLLALKALHIGPGDLVVVPSFTFFATAGAVYNAGAKPVFCDIEENAFSIDPNSLERTVQACYHQGILARAVIPVHLYGQVGYSTSIQSVAERYALSVVEDAAQALGSSHGGLMAGSLGQLGCFSFFPTKNLGAYGDGGMIVTNSDALAEEIRLLRVHGAQPKYHHRIIGFNSRLDTIQAAVLKVKLNHLERWNVRRKELARIYDQKLGDIGWIIIPRCLPLHNHLYHQYTIRVLEGLRDSLKQHLKDCGIDTEIYYPLSLHQQECFQHDVFYVDRPMVSERMAGEVLSLPIFPEMTDEEQEHVIGSIVSFTGEKIE